MLRSSRLWVMDHMFQYATGVTEYPAGTLNMVVASDSGFQVSETVTGGTSGATAKLTNLSSSSVGDLEANTMAITVPTGLFVSGETIMVAPARPQALCLLQ